ncbi:MAG: flagellar biosynthetic protein FliO [Chitinivibrionia bacterium]|nr:flagellar biosynthetic protein FliO [Chitinivibrionia bacterium]
MKNLLLVILCTLFLSFTVFAQQQNVDNFDMNRLSELAGGDAVDLFDADMSPQFGGGNQESMGIILLRIVGSLALVLAIVAAAAWGVRKSGIFGKGIAAATSQTPSMSVLEALATGQGGAILLLRCEGQVFLVGQTPTNYTLLRELDAASAQKIIESKGGDVSMATFKNSLANFMQNVKIQKASAVPTGRKV